VVWLAGIIVGPNIITQESQVKRKFFSSQWVPRLTRGYFISMSQPNNLFLNGILNKDKNYAFRMQLTGIWKHVLTEKLCDLKMFEPF